MVDGILLIIMVASLWIDACHSEEATMVYNSKKNGGSDVIPIIPPWKD